MADSTRMALRRGYEIDNRDLNTTWLTLTEPAGIGDSVEVDPWELVKNAIENLGLREDLEKTLINVVNGLQVDINEALEKEV